MEFSSAALIDPVRINRYLRKESLERIAKGASIALWVILVLSLVWLVRESYGSLIGASADKSRLQNEADLATGAVAQPARADSAHVDYGNLARLNPFGQLGAVTGPAQPAAKPVTNLALNLIGTFISSDSDPYAIIEDDKKKIQDVFNIGDLIFNESKLRKIYPDRVEIDRDGQIEVLKLDDAPDAGSSSESGVSAASQDEFIVQEAELNQALENLPLLLTQARAVPYFKDGRSIGLRLFAIRSGSLFEKIGLKNGDILKSINGQSLSDLSQAMKLFERLRDERSVSVLLERDRADREMKYQIR